MIPLIKSTYYEPEKTAKALAAFIQSAEILSCSTECLKFEEKFAVYQGRKYSVLLNSGSSANLAMIQSLLNLGRLKKGDKVGFSSLTWSTNVMPIIQLGLQAVPVDVELETLNISSKTVKEVLKDHRLKMLFVTNLLGFCDDLDEIEKICKEKGIIILEDNCESLGTVYRGRKLGNFGLASSVSFYVGHHMSTIEGGAAATDDEELATMMKVVRAHGWDRNLHADKQTEIRKKHKVNSTFYSRYTFYDLGYNLRPTEICGFLGNNQIQYLDEITKKRQENYFRFAEAIYTQTDRYMPIRTDHLDFVSNFAVPVICRTSEIRAELVDKCDGKVEIRPIVGGDMTRQPFYKKYMDDLVDFQRKTNAHLIHDQGLYFGNNPELTDDEIETIISIFTS